MIRLRLTRYLPIGLLALAACQTEDPKPAASNDALLTRSAWLLTETRLNGQLTGSGSTVKDQYDVHFASGGTYHRTYVADNSAVQGQWQLTTPTTLHLVDHKGDPHDYTVQLLDNTTLRLAWQEQAGEAHVDTYTAH